MYWLSTCADRYLFRVDFLALQYCFCLWCLGIIVLFCINNTDILETESAFGALAVLELTELYLPLLLPLE